MAKVYANLIRKGAENPKTGKPYKVEDVEPESLRKAVEKELAKKG